MNLSPWEVSILFLVGVVATMLFLIWLIEFDGWSQLRIWLERRRLKREIRLADEIDISAYNKRYKTLSKLEDAARIDRARKAVDYIVSGNPVGLTDREYEEDQRKLAGANKYGTEERPSFSQRLAATYLRAAIANEPGSRWPEKLRMIWKHHAHGGNRKLWNAMRDDQVLYWQFFQALAPEIREGARWIRYFRGHYDGAVVVKEWMESKHDEDFMASMGWTATDETPGGDPKGEAWIRENLGDVRNINAPRCATEAAAEPASALERFDMARHKARYPGDAEHARAWGELVDGLCNATTVFPGIIPIAYDEATDTCAPAIALNERTIPVRPLANGWDNFGATQYRNGVRTDGHEPMAIREPTIFRAGDEALADMAERTWRSLEDPHYKTRDEVMAEYHAGLELRRQSPHLEDPAPSWASAFSHHHERPCREMPHGT